MIGQLRGLGWISGSCRHCAQCLGGTGNLCASLESTFVGHQVASLETLADQAGRFDLVINTVNHALDWAAVMRSLAPQGRLHQLGAVLGPIEVGAFDLIMARRGDVRYRFVLDAVGG